MDLVVSHFNEDLRWLKKIPVEFNLTLYLKGEIPDLTFLDATPNRRITLCPLPNVGREAHSWLYHLGRVCESPPEWSVFLQGHPFDHCHDAHQRLKALAEGGSAFPESGFEWWGFLVESDDPMGRRVFVPWSKNKNHRELDIGKRYREMIGSPDPPVYRFYPGGQFVLSGEVIQRRSAEFYRRLAERVSRDEDAAYCLERFWDQVFGIRAVSEESMGGQETLYLKPIRRLQPRKWF